MLQWLFTKESSNPLSDKADWPIEPTPSADQSTDLTKAPSMATQYHDARQLFVAGAAYRQMPTSEQVCVEAVLANAAKLPKLNQIRRRPRDPMTSVPENNRQHFARSLESAHCEPWRKRCESTGVV